MSRSPLAPSTPLRQPMLMRLVLLLLSVGLLALTACESESGSPLGPELDGHQGSTPEQTAAQVVGSQWQNLASTDRLEEEVRAAVEGAGTEGVPERVRNLLQTAGELSIEVSEAEDAGRATDALSAERTDVIAEAAVEVFGATRADTALEGVRTTLERVRDALAGSSVSPAARSRLEAAEDQVLAAEGHLEADEPTEALAASSIASGELEALAPERQAQHSIDRARALLDRGLELLTGAESAPEAATSSLESAAETLSQAEEAFAAGAFTRSIPLGRRSAALSRRAIAILESSAGNQSGSTDDDGDDDADDGNDDGDDDGDDEDSQGAGDAAEAAIADAEELLERVRELAGAEPSERISGLIESAEDFLGRAVDAYEAEVFTEAIPLARRSGAFSRQALGLLNGGDDDDDGDDGNDDENGDDDGDGAEGAAAAAIQDGEDLLERAREMAGDDPSERVLDLLTSAEEYLDKAIEAYAAEAFTQAIPLARRSTGLSQQAMGLLRGGR